MMTHEGGYSSIYVLRALLRADRPRGPLSGHRTGIEDPFDPIFSGFAGQDLQPHQSEVIEAAAELPQRLATG
jgi:hypothetical protein